MTGYNKEDFGHATADRRSEFIDVEDRGTRWRWPVASPVGNYSELVTGYFEDRYGRGSSERVYYLSFPQEDRWRAEPAVQAELISHLERWAREHAVLVYEAAEGNQSGDHIADLLSRQLPHVQVGRDEFESTSNGTPAAEIHFEGLTRARDEVKRLRQGRPYRVETARQTYADMVRRGEVDVGGVDGPVLLDPADTYRSYRAESPRSTIDRLWEICSAGFALLTENTPFRCQQTRRELESMLADPDTLVLAQRVGGEIAAFMTLVGDIGACEWLDADYYARRYPGEIVMYIPGIATDPAMRGERYSLDIAGRILDVLASTIDEVRLVFQCTNLSADYVPMLVKEGINASRSAQVSVIHEITRYR